MVPDTIKRIFSDASNLSRVRSRPDRLLNRGAVACISGAVILAALDILGSNRSLSSSVRQASSNLKIADLSPTIGKVNLPGECR